MTLPPLLQSRFHRWLLPGLLVASLMPIWSIEYFPSQNGPWHLLTVRMMHEYENPAFNYRQFYAPSIHAIPHLANTLLVYALGFLFPLLTAHRIAISLYVLLLPISVFWFLATVNRNRMAPGYVSFLLIYNVPLLRGYHDYVLGIPLVFLTLTYWLRNRDRLILPRAAVVALLIVLVYLSHLFNFAVLGLAMGVFAVHRSGSLRPLLPLAALFLPAFALFAEFAWFSAYNTKWLNPSELTFMAPHQAAESFFGKFFYTMSATGYHLSVLPLLLGAPFLIRTVVKSYRRSGSVWYRAIVATPALTMFFLLALLYFVTPFELLGWHYVNIRFIPYVIVFGLASLMVSGQAARRAAVASVAVAALGVYGIMTYHFVKTGRQIREYTSAIEKVDPNSVLLSLAFDSSKVGRISPLARAYEYYPIFRGGVNGQGIARFNTVTPIVYRTYPVNQRFPAWGPDGPADMARIASAYDYVLMWGLDGYAAIRLRQAAFELVHEQGKLRLFKNRRGRSERDVEAAARSNSGGR